MTAFLGKFIDDQCSLHTAQKMKFSIEDFLGHIYWRDHQWETSFFVPCHIPRKPPDWPLNDGNIDR